MSHFGSASPNQGVTPPEWMPLTHQITALVQEWADRDDLLAYVGPGAGRGKAPALFDPYVSEVEVDIEKTFGEGIQPGEIEDMTERDTLFEWPEAAGVILHEAMHAKFTTWDLKDAYKALDPQVYDIMHTLEESRIEGRGVDLYPQNRQFLRASALGISINDTSDEALEGTSSVRSGATLAAYSLARVDAGVLEASDITKIQAHLDAVLGDELIAQLRSIWTRFHAVKNPKNNVQTMYKLAQEWDELLKEESEKRGEDDQITQEELEEMLNAMQGDQEGTGRKVMRILIDQQTSEKWEEELQEKESENAEKKKNETKSKQVFGAPAPTGTGSPGNRIMRKRPPSGDEHAAAIRIGKELDKAKYRDRDKTELTSRTPPGRMRSRAVVQNAAYKAKRIPASAEPFKRTARKHTDEPTLQIGMMTDVSGSMNSAMEPIAVANWVFSEASRRIQAKIASVYYGYSVTPGLAVGQHLEQVITRDARDGAHDFDGAFRALDGALNLLHGSGARLLVICSDGDYESHQVKAAQTWLKRCEQAGVGVLWLTFAAGGTAVRLCQESAAELHYVNSSPTAASYAIGAMAARALTQAGRNQ
jgi:hypothetical protein